MKNPTINFFTLIFLFISITAFSQDFGIRAGINLTNVTGDVEGNTMKIGFQVGPVMDYAINEEIDFHTGLLYSMKGAGDDDTDDTVNFNYLDIPLLVRYSSTGGFYGEVGPSIGLLMSAKSGDNDIKNNTSSLDLGILIGVGYDLGTIRIDLRYGVGLSNVLDVDSSDATVKNSVITIGASYML